MYTRVCVRRSYGTRSQPLSAAVGRDISGQSGCWLGTRKEWKLGENERGDVELHAHTHNHKFAHLDT